MMTPSDQLRLLAPNLTKSFPRSPRALLGGYVLAARSLDKCRAELAGTNGEYHFNCPLDRMFFDFTGIDADDFKDFVAIGTTDAEVSEWLARRSQVSSRAEIIAWNNKLRCTRLCDLSEDLQVYLEDYSAQFVRQNHPVYVWFDIYDLEEQRL
jgi:hypothetical protein